MTNKLAIIGGGITGLSLAYFLLKKGYQVTIFEKENQLGGLAGTFKFEDTNLEKFYHHFFVQDALAIQLLEELGIKDQLFWVSPRMGFYREGKIRAFSTPLDLLNFKPLSLIERFRLGLLSLTAKREKDWLKLEKITARDWLSRKLGSKAYAKVWQPMLEAKFGQYAAEVPASWVWGRLKARSQSRGKFGWQEKLGYLKGGYRILLDALEQKITSLGGEIKLNSGTGVLPLPDYDFTVVTTPNALRVAYVKYLGAVGVVLKLKKSISKYYWTNIADKRIPFCVMVEHTNAFTDQNYNNYKIIYLANYVENEAKLSDQEVFEQYFNGLRIIKPDLEQADVLEYFVFRAKYAQPIPALNHSQHLPPFQLDDKLFLVSNLQIYPEDRGVNDSIKLAWKFVAQL